MHVLHMLPLKIPSFIKQPGYLTVQLFFSVLDINYGFGLYRIWVYVQIETPNPRSGKTLCIYFFDVTSLGMMFFIVSFIYLKAYQETSKKHKNKW